MVLATHSLNDGIGRSLDEAVKFHSGDRRRFLTHLPLPIPVNVAYM